VIVEFSWSLIKPGRYFAEKVDLDTQEEKLESKTSKKKGKRNWLMEGDFTRLFLCHTFSWYSEKEVVDSRDEDSKDVHS
jgi:hypothetical protein